MEKKELREKLYKMVDECIEVGVGSEYILISKNDYMREIEKAREEILGEVLSKGRDLSVLHLAPHIPVSDVEEILSKLKDNK